MEVVVIVEKQCEGVRVVLHCCRLIHSCEAAGVNFMSFVKWPLFAK